MELRLPGEITYAIFLSWVGTCMTLYMISSVCTMMAEKNAEEQVFFSLANQIRFFAKSKNLPAELERHILEHAAWRWRTTHFVDEVAISEGLSGGVQQSLGMFRGIGLVSRMPFFQGMDSECVRTVVLQLRVQHLVGFDFLASEGDVCQGCYFITIGQLAMVSRMPEAKLQRHLEKLDAEVEGGDYLDECTNVTTEAEDGRRYGRISEVINQGDLMGEEALLQEWR
jgi:hypothetical protein